MVGKGTYWCQGGCGKKVQTNYQKYEGTSRNVYVCNTCGRKYLKEGRDVVKIEDENDKAKKFQEQ
jgi:DNA-directed RNA polymerase subunit RPC12/RpoP